MTTTRQNTQAVTDLFYAEAVADRAELLRTIARGSADIYRDSFDSDAKLRTQTALAAAEQECTRAYQDVGRAMSRFAVALGIDTYAIDAEVKRRIRNKDHEQALAERSLA